MKIADFVLRKILRLLKEREGITKCSLERLRDLKNLIYDRKEFTPSEIDTFIELDRISIKLPSAGEFTQKLNDELHGIVYRQLYILFYKFLRENRIYDEFTKRVYEYHHIKTLKSYIVQRRQNPFYFISNAFPWGYSPNYDWLGYDTMWTEYLIDFMNKEMTRQTI